MRSDRYTKVVLTVIAVCLSLLTLATVGPHDLTPSAEATISPASSRGAQAATKPGGEVDAFRAPNATLPLRWRIPTAFETIDPPSDTYCSTVISVRNLTINTINVEVEWLRWDLNVSTLQTMPIPGYRMLMWATNDLINLEPYFPDDDAGLASSFIGYANVHADDPRILVTATVLCRDGTATGAKILSQNEVPATPVGATAEYFQAGMPPTWTPPRVAPDVPEMPR